jgi:hypothetical protein
MGIYLLQEEIHHKMDTSRANFFWHGPHLKKKYLMAKWELMATPKRAGRVGFTETRVMNKLLTRKVHSTPNTQQAEQSWLHTRRERKTCQSIFSEN